MRSRLSRSVEQRTKKRLYLSLLGIVVTLFLLLRFGLPFLINFSVFLANSKGTQQSEKQTGNQFIAPPSLDSTFTATNSATVSISGSAGTKQKVSLYVNNSVVDITDTNNDGTFIFKDVSLQTGNNTIEAKAKQDNSESDYSNLLTITYKNSPPSLTIDNPSDGQSFQKDQSTITIAGKTDPDVKVTVNDFWAIVDDKGNYSYNLHLQNGDNQIKVDAVDDAGNKTEKSIKVTYSQ